MRDLSCNFQHFHNATPYIDFKTKKHLKKTKVSAVDGDIYFISLDRLNFWYPSRKDDLMSLCYMLLYLMCHKNLPMLEIPGNIKTNDEKKMKFIKTYKENFSLARMCQSQRCHDLSYFCMNVTNMRYDTKPDYSRLRKMLEDLYKYEM